MKCPDCGGSLRVYRTYHLSSTHTRHYRQCAACGEKFRTEETLGERLTGQRVSAVDALTRWGLSDNKARKLAKQHPARMLKEYSSNLAAIIQSYEAQNGPVRDKAAFLAWAIENNYAGSNGNGSHPDSPPVVELPAIPPQVAVLPDTSPQAAVRSAEESAWQIATGMIQNQMTRATFETVIRPTRLISLSDGVAIIGVHNDMAKDWLENRLRDVVQRALASVCEVQKIEFILLEKIL